MVLLAKSKFNIIEVFNRFKNYSKPHHSNDEFVSINNALKKFYCLKEEIKNSDDKQKFKLKFKLHIKQCYLIVWSVEKIQKVQTQKLKLTQNRRIMFTSNCAVCGIKKSKFIRP